MITADQTAARERQAHQIAIRTTVAEVAAYLQEVLGSKLTAYIAGAEDSKSVSRWVRGTAPREDSERRLRTAYQVFHLLLSEESDHTVRAWFIGMNPQLDDEAPATALAQDRAQDVLAAARAFITGG